MSQRPDAEVVKAVFFFLKKISKLSEFSGNRNIDMYIYMQKWILEFDADSKKNFLSKESDWKLSTQV